MKTRYKFLIVVGIIILLVTALNYYSYNKYTSKQKERIGTFFEYNYNNIDSLTFTETKKKTIGSLDFHGYFNSDKSNSFIGSVMPYQKEFERNNVMDADFSRKNDKFKDRKTYSVSEIEKIQRKEPREDKEKNSSSWFSDSTDLSKYAE